MKANYKTTLLHMHTWMPQHTHGWDIREPSHSSAKHGFYPYSSSMSVVGFRHPWLKSSSKKINTSLSFHQVPTYSHIVLITFTES